MKQPTTGSFTPQGLGPSSFTQHWVEKNPSFFKVILSNNMIYFIHVLHPHVLLWTTYRNVTMIYEPIYTNEWYGHIWGCENYILPEYILLQLYFQSTWINILLLGDWQKILPLSYMLTINAASIWLLYLAGTWPLIGGQDFCQ